MTAKAPPDHRLIVLVTLGLCLFLPHLYSVSRRTTEDHKAPGQQSRLVWLETASAHGSGLYWLEDPAGTWPLLSAALGLHAPAKSLPPAVDAFLPAYRLSADGKLQAIPSPAQAAPIFSQPISINQATLATLMIIPGIGPRLAASIIDYRDRMGGIHERAALRKIEGIGERKAAIIAEHVRFD